MGPALIGGWIGGRLLGGLALWSGLGWLAALAAYSLGGCAAGAGHRGVAADRAPALRSAGAVRPASVRRASAGGTGESGRRPRPRTAPGHSRTPRLVTLTSGQPGCLWLLGKRQGMLPRLNLGAGGVPSVRSRGITVGRSGRWYQCRPLPFARGRLRRVAAPGAVEGAGPVDALEAVGAEEVALGLQQVGGGAAGAHHVEVAERRARAPGSGCPRAPPGRRRRGGCRGCGSASRRSAART